MEHGRACVHTAKQLLALEDFSLVWHLGLGRKQGFLDRMELLSALPRRRVVTPPKALALQHGKLHLCSSSLATLVPQTFASQDPSFLKSRMDCGDWVLKPVAGSFGRGVQAINADTADLGQILDAACKEGMVLVQRHIPCGAQPELRVLFADGNPIGSYGRIATEQGTANLARGAAAVELFPDSSQAASIAQVGAWLSASGIGFAAADLRGKYLIDINIANPGGLATIERLSGEDLTGTLVEQLCARC